MKLIDNWKSWYRMYSAQALAIVVSLQVMLAAFPPSVTEAKIPFSETTWGQLAVALTVLVAVLGFIGRLIDQGPTTKSSGDQK